MPLKSPSNHFSIYCDPAIAPLNSEPGQVPWPALAPPAYEHRCTSLSLFIPSSAGYEQINSLATLSLDPGCTLIWPGELLQLSIFRAPYLKHWFTLCRAHQKWSFVSKTENDLWGYQSTLCGPRLQEILSLIPWFYGYGPRPSSPDCCCGFHLLLVSQSVYLSKLDLGLADPWTLPDPSAPDPLVACGVDLLPGSQSNSTTDSDDDYMAGRSALRGWVGVGAVSQPFSLVLLFRNETSILNDVSVYSF